MFDPGTVADIIGTSTTMISACTVTSASPALTPRLRDRVNTMTQSRSQMSGGRVRGLRVSLPKRRTPASNVTRAAFGEIERARGQDYASAAEVFVEAFFLRKGGAADVITKSELAYLNGAQKRDMVGRYHKRGVCAMYVMMSSAIASSAGVGKVRARVRAARRTARCRRARWEPHDREESRVRADT